MPWTEMRPTTRFRNNKRPRVAVTCLMTRTTKRDVEMSQVVITFRVAEFEGLPWLMRGAPVDASLGTGEHAGLLRVEHRISGQFTLLLASSGNAGGLISLRLPVLAADSQGVRRPNVVCDYEYNDTWIEVTLPGWAVAALGGEKP